LRIYLSIVLLSELSLDENARQNEYVDSPEILLRRIPLFALPFWNERAAEPIGSARYT
jgi:hypothetical protein